MRFTLSQAAKEAGVSKGTLSKALSSGRLSGERREDGSFQIDAAELFRVFPRKPQEPRAGTVQQPPATVQRTTETPGEQAETAVELAVLRTKLEAAEARIADMGRERETILVTVDDLRRRLDTEQEERRSLQRLLAAPAPAEKPQEAPATVPVVTQPPPAAKGFLARLLGRG